MVCPPARNIISHCLPLSPHMCAFVDGASAFPSSCLPLSPIVSHCLPVLVSHCHPTCVPVRCCARLPAVLPPLVSHCLHTCVPVLDGASAFPRSCLCLSPIVSDCLPLSPIVSPHVCRVGWCVRLPDVLSSLALADASAYPRSCLPLSPSLPACVPALDAVSAFPGSCLRLSPIVRCVRLPKVLSLLVTRCFPLCLLRSPSRGLVSPCLRLWPIVSHMCACVGWWAQLPEVLPPLVCHFCPHACLCWSTFPRSCFLLSHMCACSVWLPLTASPQMVHPLPRGLASPCLPVSPHM